MRPFFFINRRSGQDRRSGEDQRQNPRLDLSHRRRRKTDDRRQADLVKDFYTITRSDVNRTDGTGNQPH